LKISTLNSRTFHTFPGSVQTLHMHKCCNGWEQTYVLWCTSDTSTAAENTQYHPANTTSCLRGSIHSATDRPLIHHWRTVFTGDQQSKHLHQNKCPIIAHKLIHLCTETISCLLRGQTNS